MDFGLFKSKGAMIYVYMQILHIFLSIYLSIYIGLPNFKNVMAIDSVSWRPHHVWSQRENFGFWGSYIARKCTYQPCSMDISVCQSTPFSVLCTMKYPFTWLLKKANSFASSIASPNLCHI